MSSSKADEAENLFRQGYNCCQAVVGAFAKETGLSLSTALRVSCSHGGGVGRLREICGALSGAEMVLGLLYGYDTPEIGEVKAAHYARVQEAAFAFRNQFGSYLCRELLGVAGQSSPVPTPRSEAFYTQRPCLKFVRFCAEYTEKMIEQCPYTEKNTGNAAENVL